MIRIICRVTDFAAAANGVDMKPSTEFRTFDIEAPDVEFFLTQPRNYVDREVVGVEVLPELKTAAGGPEVMTLEPRC